MRIYEKILNGEIVRIPIPASGNNQLLIAEDIVNTFNLYYNSHFHVENPDSDIMDRFFHNILFNPHDDITPDESTFVIGVVRYYIVKNTELILPIDINRTPYEYNLKYCMFDKKNNRVLMSKRNAKKINITF